MQPHIQLSKLDASMACCGVMFLCGYHFRGELHTEYLRQSVEAILVNVARLQYDVHSDNRFRATLTPRANKLADTEKPATLGLFRVIETEDLQQTYRAVYQSLGTEGAYSDRPPMQFVLLRPPKHSKEFMILQCGRHSHCDGSSAVMLLNWVVEYYNALQGNDQVAQEKLVAQASRLNSPGPDEIYSLWTKRDQTRIRLPRQQHIKNIARLMSYKTLDNGGHATAFKDIPHAFARFRDHPTPPLTATFQIKELIQQCHTEYAELSPHNIVCALIAQAFQQVKDSSEDGRRFKTEVSGDRQVSFRVMIDILNLAQRRTMIGNYIAYVPITVDGSLPLADLAHVISQRVLHVKQSRADVSMYKMLEFALGSGMATRVNDPVSYIVSGINNLTQNANPNFLQGATCDHFHALANAIPRDEHGAKLNNRPTLCFSISRQYNLCLSFFNTVSDPQTPHRVLNVLSKCFQQVSPVPVTPPQAQLETTS